jgi:hypothetical protein
LEGDGGSLLWGRLVEDPDEEIPDSSNVFIDVSQPNPRRQLIAELRRVAAIWTSLTNKVENPSRRRH